MVALGFVPGKAKVKAREKDPMLTGVMVMTPLMRLRERVKVRKVKARKARIKVKVRMVKTLQEKDHKLTSPKLILQLRSLPRQPFPHQHTRMTHGTTKTFTGLTTLGGQPMLGGQETTTPLKRETGRFKSGRTHSLCNLCTLPTCHIPTTAISLGGQQKPSTLLRIRPTSFWTLDAHGQWVLGLLPTVSLRQHRTMALLWNHFQQTLSSTSPTAKLRSVRNV